MPTFYFGNIQGKKKGAFVDQTFILKPEIWESEK